MTAMRRLDISADSVAFLRRRLRTLVSEPLTASVIASNIAFGAAVAGSGHIEMVQNGPWWLLASEHNWMGGADDGGEAVGEDDLFERIVPFPAQGPTSHRAEIYVTAFANEAYFCIDGKTTWIVGEACAPVHEGVVPPWCETVLAFRFADDAS